MKTRPRYTWQPPLDGELVRRLDSASSTYWKRLAEQRNDQIAGIVNQFRDGYLAALRHEIQYLVDVLQIGVAVEWPWSYGGELRIYGSSPESDDARNDRELWLRAQADAVPVFTRDEEAACAA